MRDSEFEAFVRSRRGSLVRVATLMTAGDTHLAEDVVQHALVRLYVAWARASRGNVDAYARRVLVNGLIDEKRRPAARRERAVAQVPDWAAAEPADPDSDLIAALAALPAGMRAAVVLRHVEGLSVEQVADALGCSTGTVKSQTARGLDKLRAALAPTHEGAQP